MDAFDVYLNELVNKNRKTFSEFPGINWLNSYRDAEKIEWREQLLKTTENRIFKDTKPFHNQISKGCMLCGLGVWSCLFITGKCNANCFYCPISQTSDEPPGTQNFTFDTPESYTDYISHFGFKGVSFSGGEPLLYFDRTIQYLKQIRKKCSPDIYIWMYTNGILAEREKLLKLAKNGLNEIRFDIGATGYQLERVKQAKGIISNVTIEIPAVPEEKENLKKLLPAMIKAGVTNLNLHQLRLTKYNAKKLLKRNYTYIPAEQPIVLESELAALEILDYAAKNHLDIGINYCSFHFKNRFQKAGFRKQVANAFAQPNDIITEKGFIRKFTENSVGYESIKLSDKELPGGEHTKLQLPNKKFWASRETVMRPTNLNDQFRANAELMFYTEPEKIPEDQLLFKIWQMEYTEKGLREY